MFENILNFLLRQDWLFTCLMYMFRVSSKTMRPTVQLCLCTQLVLFPINCLKIRVGQLFCVFLIKTIQLKNTFLYIVLILLYMNTLYTEYAPMLIAVDFITTVLNFCVY